jgi:hypothetical protein
MTKKMFRPAISHQSRCSRGEFSGAAPISEEIASPDDPDIQFDIFFSERRTINSNASGFLIFCEHPISVMGLLSNTKTLQNLD